MPQEEDKTTHVWHQYTVTVNLTANSLGVSSQDESTVRDTVMAKLAEQGIGSMCYYPIPIHLQEAFSQYGYKKGDLPTTEKLAERVISLPMYPELTEKAFIEWLLLSIKSGKKCYLRQALVRFMQRQVKTMSNSQTSISSNAYISSKAQIAKNVKIAPSVFIADGVIIEENVSIEPGVIIYENVHIKANTFIGAQCILGERLFDYLKNDKYTNPVLSIGKNSIIRSGTIIYADCSLGDNFQTGHKAVIREKAFLEIIVRLALCLSQTDT